jgi:hypothetical protein
MNIFSRSVHYMDTVFSLFQSSLIPYLLNILHIHLTKGISSFIIRFRGGAGGGGGLIAPFGGY